MPIAHVCDDEYLAALRERFGVDVPGMIRIGARAAKSAFCEPGDDHKPGAKCTIAAVVAVGSVPEFPDEGGYFVFWDDQPSFAIGFVVARKLVPIED